MEGGREVQVVVPPFPGCGREAPRGLRACGCARSNGPQRRAPARTNPLLDPIHSRLQTLTFSQDPSPKPYQQKCRP